MPAGVSTDEEGFMRFYLGRFVIVVVLFGLSAAVVRAQSAATTAVRSAISAPFAADEPALDLDALIRAALEHNPAIQAAMHRLEAAKLRPDQERKLPDPMLSAGWNSSGNPLPGAGLGSEPTANIGLMVTQPLPYPGKRDLRAAVAGHEVDAEAHQLDALRLDVRSRVKQAYARLAFATGRFDDALAQLPDEFRVPAPSDRCTVARTRTSTREGRWTSSRRSKRPAIP